MVGGRWRWALESSRGISSQLLTRKGLLGGVPEDQTTQTQQCSSLGREPFPPLLVSLPAWAPRLKLILL